MFFLGYYSSYLFSASCLRFPFFFGADGWKRSLRASTQTRNLEFSSLTALELIPPEAISFCEVSGFSYHPGFERLVSRPKLETDDVSLSRKGWLISDGEFSLSTWNNGIDEVLALPPYHPFFERIESFTILLS